MMVQQGATRKPSSLRRLVLVVVVGSSRSRPVGELVQPLRHAVAARHPAPPPPAPGEGVHVRGGHALPLLSSSRRGRRRPAGLPEGVRRPHEALVIDVDVRGEDGAVPRAHDLPWGAGGCAGDGREEVGQGDGGAGGGCGCYVWGGCWSTSGLVLFCWSNGLLVLLS